MACRRCSTCSIDYPVKDAETPEGKDYSDPCDACDGGLSYFSNIEPAEDWREQVGQMLWRADEGWAPLWGGATMMTRFQREIESLAGADDFVFECGPLPAPRGQDW